MKNIIITTALLLFSLFLFSSPLHADDPASGYGTFLINGIDLENDPDAATILYKQGNNGRRIDGNAPTVVVTFANLEANKDYWLCGLGDQENCPKSEGNKPWKFKSNEGGQIIVETCGNGPDHLKGGQLKIYDPFERDLSKRNDGKGDGVLKERCKYDKDYFHEGHIYKLSLYDSDDMEGPLQTARFYVAHSYPKVKLVPTKPDESTALPLASVFLEGRRPGGNNKNNYQVLIEGKNVKYKKEECFTIHETDLEKTLKGNASSDLNKNKIVDDFETLGINSQGYDEDKNTVVPEHILNGTGWTDIKPLNESIAQPNESVERYGYGVSGGMFARDGHWTKRGLGKGTYLLKINERVSDDRPIGNTCEGGHSYLYITFQISLKDPSLKSSTTHAFNWQDYKFDILDVSYDPNEVDDIRAEKTLPLPIPPCAKGAWDADLKRCSKFDTAIGIIDLEPKAFITKLYTLILSASGVIGFIMLLLAGYKLLTSQGNKEKVGQARDQITAVIMGIIFIVLAFAILEIIGIDILHIPGITR